MAGIISNYYFIFIIFDDEASVYANRSIYGKRTI